MLLLSYLFENKYRCLVFLTWYGNFWLMNGCILLAAALTSLSHWEPNGLFPWLAMRNNLKWQGLEWQSVKRQELTCLLEDSSQWTVYCTCSTKKIATPGEVRELFARKPLETRLKATRSSSHASFGQGYRPWLPKGPPCRPCQPERVPWKKP
jgi:hypothetical protein